MMDKPEYICLVSAASVDNTPKFSHVDHKRLAKMRGRPLKHFRPLFQKEKELQEHLRQIFLKKLPIHFLQRVPGSLIFIAYLRLTKPRWDEVYFISNRNLQLQSGLMA